MILNNVNPPLRLTERIWLRAFGTTPKFPFGKLRIRSKHYVKCGKGDTLKINQEDSRV